MRKAISIGVLLACTYLQADNFVFFNKPMNNSHHNLSAKEKQQLVVQTPTDQRLTPPKEEIMHTAMSTPMANNSMEMDTTFQDGYWIQAGAFSKMKYAMERKARISLLTNAVDLYEKDGYKRVVVGPFKDRTEVTENLKMIKEKFPDAFLTTKDHFK